MKLLIIDNNPEVVDSVEVTLGMTWPEATTLSASSGNEGVYAADSEAPNLIILEVDLPDLDGFSVCREIRRFSDAPIIILTDRARELDKVRGLEVGADDYIVKPLRPMVFVARVKAVLRRADPTQSLAMDRIIEYRDLKVDFSASRVTLEGIVLDLTSTEFRLLGHMVRNAGKIMPSRILLGLVWGREHLDETQFLKVHIKHLRRKLMDDAAAPKFIFTERQVGYGFAKVAA